MGRLEYCSPRDAWGGEATAFTPLLSESDMLQALGNETGIGPLDLIETEHSTAGGRSLDILVETSDGRRIAIENQYRTADHDHLTRGLAYAVATGSRGLLLIAEDHREEFRSVADYMNDLAALDPERGINVWLVQVRALRRVGDTIWSPQFVVQAEPNQWEANVRRSVTPNLSSVEEFYDTCAGPDWATRARGIIEYWIAKPGASEGHKSQNNVGLYQATSEKDGIGTNLMQLRNRERITICRGFLWKNSGLFNPEQEPVELDDAITRFFPDAQSTDKQFYLRVSYDKERICGFLDWFNSFANSRR